MKVIKTTWDNIIFEFRNKEYGAYKIRKEYSKNIMISVFIVISSFILLLTISSLLKKGEKETLLSNDQSSKIIYYAELAPPPPIEKTYLPPKEIIKKQSVQKVVKYVAPKVTEEEVNDVNDIPTIEEIRTNVTGSQNIEGTENIVYEEPVKIETIPKEEKIVYNFAQKQPEFPGGQGAMIKFLRDNLRYPSIARESGIEGTVIVRFTVNENGKVEDITIMRGFDKSCDEEAIRVIKKMPDWNAGEQNGKKVNVRFVVPIRFVLN